MNQLKDLADERLLQWCIYCGSGRQETKDHVPSRVFLDPPFPENLPVVYACYPCNNGLSRDEQYLACLVECAIAGSTDPDRIRRPKIANTLRRSAGLRSSIESEAKVVGEKLVFTANGDRVRNVFLKLARGHAAYELSLPFRYEPTFLEWWPLAMMTDQQRDSYEAADVSNIIGEVGSRGTQRSLVTQVTLLSAVGEQSVSNLVINNWVDVQEGRYRYLAVVDDHSGIRIKIILAEFLACEILWADTAV